MKSEANLMPSFSKFWIPFPFNRKFENLSGSEKRFFIKFLVNSMFVRAQDYILFLNQMEINVC